MKPGLVPLFVVLTGCGMPHAAVMTPEPSWPALCAGEPDAHTSHDPPEDPDCWRAHFPVHPCDAPVHPELIGLWGLGGSRFEGRLIYDGCCVTFYDTGLRRMTPTLDMASELATYGRPANVGAANRTQAEWDGDTLSSDSHLGTIAVGHRVLEDGLLADGLLEDGTAGLTFLDDRRSEPAEQRLVRFQRHDCIDEPTRDLLCARFDRPGRDTGAYGRRRVPGVVGLVTRWHEHDAVLVSTPPRSFTFSIASGTLARSAASRRPSTSRRRRLPRQPGAGRR